MNPPLGKRRWVIAEGFIPPDDDDKPRALISHETACLLNTGDEGAHVELRAFFSDREPVGPYQVSVPPRRTLHLRLNELQDPEPLPVGTDYAAVIESDVPIVVQHTRLDSRQTNMALLSTVAFSAD
jgi:hypothetical protein